MTTLAERVAVLEESQKGVHEALLRIESAVTDGDTSVLKEGKKTNDRVGKLEDWQKDMALWRERATGFATGASAVLGAMLGGGGLIGLILVVYSYIL